jgi:hypothetical protein|uniref:Uncharacterized protein n=1 Tax=viral metagenome TaxID=1070528 RepID=A0A6C0CXW6_9ZZZZ
MTDECVELKNIKYKSMLLNSSNEEVEETVENLSNLESFLQEEKNNSSNEPWIKLNKTTKLIKFQEFVEKYSIENKLSQDDKLDLFKFLSTNLDRKRFLKTKEVNYDKDSGIIISIPSLFYNSSNKKFTLKRSEKRVSTLKSLAPKKTKNKKNIDINNS